MRIKSNSPETVFIENPVRMKTPWYAWSGGGTYHFTGAALSTGSSFDAANFAAYTVVNSFSVSAWMEEVQMQELRRLYAASGKRY